MMTENSVRLIQAPDNWTTQQPRPPSQNLTSGLKQPESDNDAFYCFYPNIFSEWSIQYESKA